MAEGQGQFGRHARRMGEQRWAAVAPPIVEHEDRLTPQAAQDIWNMIYPMFQANGEERQIEVRLAVYAYYAVNGSSKRTKHERDINTGSGISVLAADVVNAIGIDQVRQFLRADVDEAYSALKETGVLERDEVFVQRATAKGVPRGYMHCAADYLSGCSLFTQAEAAYADKAFDYSVQRARGARGGMTIEEQDDRGRSVGLSHRREDNRVGGQQSVAADVF